MEDHIARCLLDGGAARVVAVSTTAVAREAARRHGAVGGAAVALGRAATAGLLLATLTKDDERVTLQVMGDGPFGTLIADANAAGDVRATMRNVGHLVTGGPARRIELGAAVGRRGLVSVVRDLGMKELFTGQTQMVTGEIDEDVEHYLVASEQIPSALGCEAVLGAHADVAASGGVLVQALPGSDASGLVREIQHRLRTGVLYDALARGVGRAVPMEAADLARAALGDRGASLQVLDVRPVRFRCRCTRERVADMLAMTGPREIDAMIAEQGGAEVACNFCGEAYRFTRPDLEEIRDGLGGEPPRAS